MFLVKKLIQRTMTICVARFFESILVMVLVLHLHWDTTATCVASLLGGDFGHGHRHFISHLWMYILWLAVGSLPLAIELLSSEAFLLALGKCI